MKTPEGICAAAFLQTAASDSIHGVPGVEERVRDFASSHDRAEFQTRGEAGELILMCKVGNCAVSVLSKNGEPNVYVDRCPRLQQIEQSLTNDDACVKIIERAPSAGHRALTGPSQAITASL